jgi:hypothetical protein
MPSDARCTPISEILVWKRKKRKYSIHAEMEGQFAVYT